MTAGARGTSIRRLGKILEAIREPVYVVGHDGRLEYFNAACSQWLGAEIARRLVDWKPSPSGSSATPLQTLAHSLQPPKVLRRGCPFSQPITPLTSDAGQTAASKEFLFIRIGDNDSSFTLAVGDTNWVGNVATESIDLVSLSRQLAATRQRYPLFRQLGPLVGSSSAAEHLRRQAMLAADCSANIFLVGRSGAGGQQLAIAIHHRSTPDQTSLTAIDCSLMDAELLESSMSPVIARLGSGPNAKATILLRSVDLLAAEAQASLRRHLVEFGPRLRCMSLSSQSARSCIDRNSLAGDLALGLSTFEIVIPSLNERISDLPLIVQYLIERRSKPNQIVEGISRPALDLLSTYPWPGDFEELDDTIRHSVSESGSRIIQPQHLPLAIRSYQPQDPAAIAEDRPIDLDRFLARIERELIDRALDRSDGNRAEAARRLGISRSRLLRRIDDIGTSETEET